MGNLDSHPYRHYLLYAKGHYVRFKVDGTVWGDLFRIQSEYTGIEDEYLKREDILRCLIDAINTFIKPFDDLLSFLMDIRPQNCWKIWPEPFTSYVELDKKYNYETAVVGKCLSLLRFARVLDTEGNTIVNLGEPDPNILEVKSKEEL